MDFLKPHGAQTDDSNVKLDAQMHMLCWEQSRTNPTVGSCISYISSRLLGPGFMFLSTDGRETSDSFDRHVRSSFVPFAKAALESIIVQGFVVYGIRARTDKTLFPAPFIFSRTTYEANMSVKRGEDVLGIEPCGSRLGKQFLFTEDAPDHTGALKSRLAKITKTVSYLEQLEYHDIHAFAIRSRPPVLTKTHTDTTFDSRDVISGAEPGLRAQDASNNIQVRNSITAHQLRHQADLISTINKSRIDTSDQFWKKHVDPAKNTFLSESLREETTGYVPRFIPLPNDADVARFEMPTERKDLVQLQKFCKNQICIGMGVPEGYIDGQVGGGNSLAATRTMDEFVRISLLPLRACLSQILLDVYGHCFGNPLHVDCVFPGAQNIDKLMDWFNKGLISREAIIRIISFTEHINVTDFVHDPGQEVLPNDNKRKRENNNSTQPFFSDP